MRGITIIAGFLALLTPAQLHGQRVNPFSIFAVPAPAPEVARKLQARVGALPLSEKPDRWLGVDKVQHFFLSFAITNFSYGTARLVGLDRGPAALTAGLTAGAAGVTKEFYDRTHGGRFSLKDLVWDGAGIATGLTLVSHAR